MAGPRFRSATRARRAAPAALLATLIAAGCGGGATGHHSPPPGPRLPSAARWLSYDPAAKTASLTLVAAYNHAYSGFNFDGYTKGQVIFEIPAGWQVTVTCDNRFTRPISCAVASLGDTTPAFPGASTPDPTVGLPPGSSATFTFTPTRPGAFRVLSLVPGDQEGGLWDVFEVLGAGTPGTTTRP
ncbi:MAG: sulfocyanin-like copper-binding protein [Streptosporangiaceae bacterium]